VAHVKTQVHNFKALALYSRAGFAVSATELTFSISPGSVVRSEEGFDKEGKQE
jgi:hypothetical protein